MAHLPTTGRPAHGVHAQVGKGPSAPVADRPPPTPAAPNGVPRQVQPEELPVSRDSLEFDVQIDQAPHSNGNSAELPVAAPGAELAAGEVVTYVLDTSVLLSGPWAILRFAEHHIVLPVVV